MKLSRTFWVVFFALLAVVAVRFGWLFMTNLLN